jgi:[ribosomal protein S18]-alanine N-acetyltransferase
MSQTSMPNSQHSSPDRLPASIRAATQIDIPAILSIEQSASSAAHWSADHYLSRIQSQPESACLLIAEFRDAAANRSQLSAFLCARIIPGEWEIENVVVYPTFRRHGIATQLMQSVIERWQAAAGTALLLEVRESNAAARALYQRHGFRETGRRPAYYREPDESAVLYTLKPDASDGS